MADIAKAVLAGKKKGGAGLYVEDVFSIDLWNGNGATQNIVNDVDLAGEGGTVWGAIRSGTIGSINHVVTDTERGANPWLRTVSTAAENTAGNDISSFNADGYSLQYVSQLLSSPVNNHVGWTFRKAPGFHDVVTWTGTSAGRQIPHNLGSVPGMIIVKCTDTAYGWLVYHTSLGATKYLYLNYTLAEGTNTGAWNDTAPTDAVFSLGTLNHCNQTGKSYVAYLFADNEPIFGENGDESIIKCGSFTTSGGIASINIGWEPQYIMFKESSGTGDWQVFDSMRGLPVGAGDIRLLPNWNSAEGDVGDNVNLTAIGFDVLGLTAAATFIYMAIRRPHKVPTSGTEVFAADPSSVSDPTLQVDAGFPVDTWIMFTRTGNNVFWMDRLRGSLYLNSNNNGTDNSTYTITFDSMTQAFFNFPASNNHFHYAFKRAPKFMDTVCYTGDGVAGRTVAHNLAVVPELMIVKGRSSVSQWNVYVSNVGATKYLSLQSTNVPFPGSTIWNDAAPIDTVFTVGTTNNATAFTYIAHLFATLAGISKVGSYTGNGTSLTLDCGFAAGARFFLCKRTDSTGDWFMWDSLRGIVAGNDPHLSLNTTTAEVTTDDSVDPDSSGIIVNQVAATNINVTSATYIYLAIA